MLLQRHPAGDPAYELLAEIRRDRRPRAADLTAQLLAFSRSSVLSREPLDLGALIGELERAAAPPSIRGSSLDVRRRRPGPVLGRRQPARTRW